MWNNNKNIDAISQQTARIFDLLDTFLADIEALKAEIAAMKLGREAQHANEFELREEMRRMQARLNRHLHD